MPFVPSSVQDLQFVTELEIPVAGRSRFVPLQRLLTDSKEVTN